MATTSSPIAGRSVSAATWTLVSRVTGFARVATIAAVLGPTYLANTYQATNLFPNVIYYLLTGTLIATLAAAAAVFGTHTSLGNVRTSELVLLGGGTTAAVGAHAALQWWGARRVGVTLVPRWGWRDPDVREVIRRAVPSLGYAGAVGVREVAILV